MMTLIASSLLSPWEALSPAAQPRLAQRCEQVGAMAERHMAISFRGISGPAAALFSASEQVPRALFTKDGRAGVDPGGISRAVLKQLHPYDSCFHIPLSIPAGQPLPSDRARGPQESCLLEACLTFCFTDRQSSLQLLGLKKGFI